MTRIIMLFVFSFGLLACATVPAGPAGADHLRLYTVKRDFDTVKEDIEIAITGRGLVIDHTSHIGAMLERTGKDLGATTPIYGNAGSMQFCSATISRRTMEADPANIVFCPYIIVYFTLPQDPKTVYVGYRRPLPAGSEASRASIREIENLLDGIVKEALNIK
ncbi:hypothetical protein SCL_0503 [Sulfuricaulis limicola]|uniref:DUF302 domain-containing protein n=1 Tax=Sulfuricaulis limicola TaxID=1620215 RepID=A0A1B4XDF2_9GAMM|nr:DUF302 domain-containing protein [Sulfuricaulis limicola]BAV32825.1 hypothetical protein SCL_0503 [Sulfuricaulis limicola]